MSSHDAELKSIIQERCMGRKEVTGKLVGWWRLATTVVKLDDTPIDLKEDLPCIEFPNIIFPIIPL